MMERQPWEDGIDLRAIPIWTYSGPYCIGRVSHRNNARWAEVVEARKILIAKALAWRDAAVADGWSSAATYPSSEDELRAFSLFRDSFHVQGLARPETKYTVGSGSISCWGPDRLTIPAGETYDWPALQAAVRTCTHCHKSDVPTHRVGFAGRVCAECLPEQRCAIETPGWRE